MDKTVDLRQALEVGDYLGALAVWCVFFFTMFIISVTCINWCCIQKHDDITVFEEFGHRHELHMRLGPHRPSFIAKHIRQPPARAQ